MKDYLTNLTMNTKKKIEKNVDMFGKPYLANAGCLKCGEQQQTEIRDTMEWTHKCKQEAEPNE